MAVGAIVYDLDGTLLDSSGTISWAINRTRAGLGLEPIARAQVIAGVGDGVRKLVERVIAPDTDVPVGQLLALFMKLYRADPISGSSTYLGVMEALAYWKSRGVAQGILTNKPHAATRPVVAALGLDAFCSVVVGAGAIIDGNEAPTKPAPDGLRWIIKQLGADPAVTWMVGDGEADVKVAQNAGIRCVAIRGGFGEPGALERLDPPPDVLVNSFTAADVWLREEAER